MSFFNEFPHTRNYDSDLAWLIERMKLLMTKMDRVDELLAEVERLMQELPEEIRQEVQRVINEMIANGYFENLLNVIVPPYIDNAVAPFLGAFGAMQKTYESSALGNISAIPQEITNITEAKFEIFENDVIAKLTVTAKCNPTEVSGLTMTTNGKIDCRIANSAADISKLSSIPIKDIDGISNIFQRQVGFYGVFRNTFMTATNSAGKEYVTHLSIAPLGTYVAGQQVKSGSSMQVGGTYGGLVFETYYVKDTN